MRFSRQHLLALSTLCTFLVPLGLFAWLGQSELRRQGELVQAAKDREVRQFVRSAKDALDQHLDTLLPALIKESQTELTHRAPTAAVRALRSAGYGTLLDILLLTEGGEVAWPPPAPPTSLGLPSYRDPRDRGGDGIAPEYLHAAELLQTQGHFAEAAQVLERLIENLVQAQTPASTNQPPGRPGTRDLDDETVVARTRLGILRRKLGEPAAARKQFEAVLAVLGQSGGGPPGAPGGPGRSFRFDQEVPQCALLAEIALAELTDDPEARCRLLRTIADGRRNLADALLRAATERLWQGIPADAECRAAAEQAREDEHAREHVRAFATDYDRFLREGMRRRLRQAGSRDDEFVHQTFTVDGVTSLLVARRATPREREALAELDPQHLATHIAYRLDLGQIVANVLAPYCRNDAFTLAVHDAEEEPLVAAPTNTPADYVAPVEGTFDLWLRAYPADAERFVAETRADVRNKGLLIATLFLTALVGALWLWRSVARAGELAQLKVDLVSRVSHELKTPLALIRLYGETLGRGRAQDDEQVARFGGIIEREADRLTTLIQRILDFSRQQAGTLQYTAHPTDLGDLLQRVADAYEPHLLARGTELDVDLPVGVVAAVDGAAFEGAIVNLLENAAKYGDAEAGEKVVTVQLRAEDGRAVVDVLDRGRGIPAAERERIFDSFYRASNAGEVRGAGLGLSLVRHFATAHGGTIRALPREGGGSIFRLELPLATAAADPSTALPADPSPRTDAADGGDLAAT